MCIYIVYISKLSFELQETSVGVTFEVVVKTEDGEEWGTNKQTSKVLINNSWMRHGP